MATFTTIKNRGGGRGALAGVLQYIRQDEKRCGKDIGWCQARTVLPRRRGRRYSSPRSGSLKQMAGSTTTSSNSLRQRMA